MRNTLTNAVWPGRGLTPKQIAALGKKELEFSKRLKMPSSGEVVIGDITLDALIADTVREFARNEPKGTSWITPVQFRVGFALGKNCAYSTMKRLLAAGLWEKTGAGNRVRYRPISKQKK